MKFGALAGVHRMGECALLVDLDDAAQVAALFRRLLADRPHDVVEVVPAERTVLVGFTDPARCPAVESWLVGALQGLGDTAVDPDAAPSAPAAGETPDVVLTVRYDGEDLAEVARQTGLSEPEVVRAHTGTDWTAAFCGFTPGFAYLIGGDPRLRVTRRESPRTRVPAGAVALAGHYCGVYPRSSPGGWQLLGHTETVLWDTRADPPALIRPGARVRFEEAAP